MKIIIKLIPFAFCLLLVNKNAVAQCDYDNDGYLEGEAPTVIGNSIIAPETWGGEFNRILNMVAGYTYEVSTCDDASFDSQLTIYPAFGGTALAYDDDGCGEIGGSSKILFTPQASGDYDILLDEYFYIDDNTYDCVDNEIEMDMVITLISTDGGGGGEEGILTIPVVVHVVYNNATENISDAQINSQITSLNNDYRKLNFDFSDAPAVFQNLGADMEINFCLASIDPNGNATSGITKTSTNETSFTYNLGDDPKNTNDGGHDNWNPEKYLNLWICDIEGDILGYSTFPSELNSSPELDGVVISYKYFGTINTNSPYNKGRTATHEIGHWLNLRHVWGDDFCGDDLVGDTPTQQEPNYGCPDFPNTSCSNGSNGDIFVDYMDYSNDACMMLFTNGQKQRTTATISAIRNDLASSNGCGNSSSNVAEVSNENAFNIFPNPASNLVTIHFNKPVVNSIIKIYNSIGVEVKNLKFLKQSETDVQLNFTDLARGLYLIEVLVNEQSSMKMIVVN